MSCDWRSERRIHPVDKVIYVCFSSHRVSHLSYGYIHLVHFFLKVWYLSGDGAHCLIFPFYTTFCLPFLWVSSRLLLVYTLVSMVHFLVDLSSQVLVLLCQLCNSNCHGL